MRGNPFRITEWWAKALYIGVAWILVPRLLAILLPAVGVDDLAIAILFLPLDLAVVAVGVRAFRADLEEVEPPRAWWRATGRPAAGFLIAAAQFGGVIVFTVRLVREGEPLLLPQVVESAVLGVFFLQSSIRLWRLGIRRHWPLRDADARHLDRKREYFTEW